MQRDFDFEGPRVEGRGAVIVAILIIIGGIMFFSVGRIGVGTVAVVVDPVMGSTTAVGDGVNAKYFFKMPWASIYKVYVATDSVHMWSDPGAVGDFPAVESLTKDGLRVDVEITVRWRTSPSAVVNLFRKFPAMDWKERAIIPIIREAIRNLIVDFTAIQTIEQRSVVGVNMKAALVEAFETEQSLAGAVILEAVNLRKISLPDNFVSAIERKLAAEQLSIAAEFNKTKLLVIASANAQSQVLEAEGLARSRLLLANSTRDAIKSITADSPELDLNELTKLYIYLETLRDIAESGKSQFIVVQGGEGQYILPIP